MEMGMEIVIVIIILLGAFLIAVIVAGVETGRKLTNTIVKQNQEIKSLKAHVVYLKRSEPEQRLKLCLKHKQEENHSHFAEENCDYCKLLAKVNK